MKQQTNRAMFDERGISLVEVLVAIMILAGALGSMVAASGHAARQSFGSRRDLEVSAALQNQMETLRATGYKAISTDTGSVFGYPMKWTVSGTDPKKLVLEVRWTDRRTGAAVRDTLVQYFPALDTL